MIMAKTELRRALEAVEAQHAEGPLDCRLEAAIDAAMSDAISALGYEMGGTERAPKRSAAVRVIIRRGLLAMLEDERQKA